MVNIELHKSVMIDILREIYSDSLLRTTLGFKGGTAAMLFYGLPRTSVDLDFNLLDNKKKSEVLKKLRLILPQFGILRKSDDKYYTLFFLLNYRKGERNIKLEISKRPFVAGFMPRNFLGISMFVMKQEDMAAEKLAALLTRRRFAARDLYDVWFFLKNHWDFNEVLLKENTGMNLISCLKKAKTQVQNVKETELLAGLGELLDTEQKMWVKNKLKDELIFQLKLRLLPPLLNKK